MLSWLPSTILRALRACRPLLVVLALGCQVGAGALDLTHDAAATSQAALRAAMVLCLGSSHPGRDGTPPVHQHFSDQAVAAAGHAFSLQPAILPGHDAAPPGMAGAAFWAGLPDATGPPARYAAGAYPTGPPAFLI